VTLANFLRPTGGLKRRNYGTALHKGGDAVRFVAPPLRKVQQKIFIFAAGPLSMPRGGFDLKILGLESRKVLRSKPPRGLKGFDAHKALVIAHGPL